MADNALLLRPRYSGAAAIASATRDVTFPEFLSRNSLRGATLTCTEPPHPAMYVERPLDNIQFPESFSGHVNNMSDLGSGFNASATWKGECLGIIPPSAHAIPETRATDARLAAPLGNCLSFPEIGKPPVGASVVRLFLLCCPSHVSRLVVAVVVDAVQRVRFSRGNSNIGKKCVKRVTPLVADRNSAFVVIAVDIVAARFHAHPTNVLVACVSSLCASMNRNPFAMKTAAA